jgi:hypothetical protein
MHSNGVDSQAFFTRVRHDLFGGRLNQGQVDGMSAIRSGWESRVAEGCEEHRRHQLAYVLATAFHETGASMQPVRETLGETDAAAILKLDAAFAGGRLPSVRRPYWRMDRSGRCWLGRGLVQLTHKSNYQTMSEVTGIDLVADPCRAMEMDVAVAILIEGMRRGSFTGRRLDHYFCAGHCDWIGARRVINGTDRATTIAGYAQIFARVLEPLPVGAKVGAATARP